MSTFTIYSTYMQKFQKFVSRNIPYDSPWVVYVLSTLEIEVLCQCAWSFLSFVLFLTCICILSLYVVYDLCDVPIFHVITKILHLPFTFYYLSPHFWLFTIILLYSHNEWKNGVKEFNQSDQNLVITHIIYISPPLLITCPIIYLPLYKISPPFWHWYQRIQ